MLIIFCLGADSMDKKKKTNGSIWGYRKQDVDEYIKTIEEDNEKKTINLQKMYDDIKEKADILKIEIERLNREKEAYTSLEKSIKERLFDNYIENSINMKSSFDKYGLSEKEWLEKTKLIQQEKESVELTIKSVLDKLNEILKM